ncbi:MAG: methionine synthase, partial [Anaerolineaceae bacterium]|nr:methionine synthase [Anaerolineaceae bacterium]
FGVKDYIAQLMFNSPPNLSDAMDLAKMLAILEMISPLENDNFRIWRQTRTGLLSYPLEDNAARAHLATSIYLQMSLKPHIIHIVGHTEADHAATADDVIAASLAARRSIENALAGQPGMSFDPEIQARKKHLIEQAQITLQAIKNIAGGRVADPLIDPGVLNKAVILGIMDAPQLKNNRFAAGKISTRVLNGSSETINAQGESISEQKRLEKFLN